MNYFNNNNEWIPLNRSASIISYFFKLKSMFSTIFTKFISDTMSRVEFRLKVRLQSPELDTDQ